MKPQKRSRILSLLISFILIFALALPVQAKTADADLSGKLVILHTNDTHGHDTAAAGKSVGTAGVSWLKQDLLSKGADVLLLSDGDVIQGSTLVSVSKGLTAINLMNEADYDLMTPGNHEFDYSMKNLLTLQKQAEFPFISANIKDEKTGQPVFTPNHVFETAHGFKVGIFGLDTPESQTKASPKNVAGLDFESGNELYQCAQTQINELKAEGCNLIVALGHLGTDEASAPNRSVDVIANTTGIDLFIDGHSHTAIPDGEKVGNTLLVSTGSNLENVGMVTYDGSSLDADLISAEKYTGGYNEQVATTTAMYDILIQGEYGKPFAKTDILLDGTRETNRTAESNLGDFAADAILTIARRNYEGTVDFALTNGGGIRESIKAGDITKNDMLTVFPFGNQITLVKITGAQVLEALEAACSACPESLGAFPQVSGISFTIDTSVPYANGAQYPESTYYAPAAPGTRIKDVRINNVPLNLEKEYTVATNDFTAAGGDTYYVLKQPCEANGLNLSTNLEDALIEYITSDLSGTIGQEYAAPQGRITIK